MPNGIPGRGYMQIGNDALELIQVSYTGETQPDDREPAVLWPDRAESVGQGARVTEEAPKLYDAVVNLASELVGWQMAPKPWPAFLPRQISLQSPIVDAQHNSTFTLTTTMTDWLNGDWNGLWPGVNWQDGAMRSVVGLVDEPSEARQFPLQFELSRNHLVVFGDSGWGKTSFLRTLIAGLAATHSPDELHVYVLDLGGRNFRSIEKLPHIGTVVYSDEEAFDERLQRVLMLLERLVDERAILLSEANANNLWEYNARNREQPLPAVLVVIDNFAELHENYESLVESTILPLVRRSLSAGVCFVVSANAPNNMPGKMFSMFGERITFKQSNTDRYMDIVGRGALDIDDIPGRGYIRVGKRPLLFQAALPVGLFGPEDGRDTLVEAEELQRMASSMRQTIAAGNLNWRSQPDHVEILPEMVPLREMLKEAGPIRPQRLQAVLGQLGSLQPALCDLKRMGPHFAIVGPPLSGKTTLLYDWVFSLAERYTPQQVAMVFIDTQRKMIEYGGEHKLTDLPFVLAAISEIEEMEGLLANLRSEGERLAGSGRELFVFIDNFDDFSEEVETSRNLPRDLAGLVRRFGREGMHFIATFTPDGGASDLKRRIQSANYGIGLQSARAVEALRVMRTPPGIREKDLIVGRGYLVKSGQATMIQVASPYEGMGIPPAGGDAEDEAARTAKALDVWVRRIRDKYPGQQAVWSTGASSTQQAKTPQQSEKLRKMLGLLQRALREELVKLGDGDGTADLVTTKLVQTDAARWQDETTVMALLKDVWRNKQKSTGLPESSIDTLISMMDDASVLLEVERLFPVEKDGQKSKTP